MNEDLRRRERCALCNAERLDVVLRLAPTPPANEFVSEADVDHPQERFPLTLLLCTGCGHLQLAEIVGPARLFRNYVYVSGTSPVFVSHFDRYAQEVISRFGVGPNSFVIDVGSNDGTLLKQFQNRGVSRVLGIDPAEKIAKEAQAAGVPTLDVFFSQEIADEVRASHGPADLICANNVFAHAEDLAGFTRGVRSLLSQDGVFAFEVSYLVDVIEKLLFDTIYHEHLAYHALGPLVRFFDSLELRLFDAERLDTHGGSLRCYVGPSHGRHESSTRLSELLTVEREMGLFEPDVYARFKRRIVERGAQLRERLVTLKREGKRIAGFGAPAKLTTLMHEFGLDKDTIDFIADDSVWKQGLFTPGTHIPVVPPSQLYEQRPDCCVIFAWNFADPIVSKHTHFISEGGSFLVPLPDFREIS